MWYLHVSAESCDVMNAEAVTFISEPASHECASDVTACLEFPVNSSSGSFPVQLHFDEEYYVTAVSLNAVHDDTAVVIHALEANGSQWTVLDTRYPVSLSNFQCVAFDTRRLVDGWFVSA